MDYQQVEVRLTEKLRELDGRLTEIKKDMGKSHSADSEEQAAERENDEVLEAIDQETQSSIREVRSALARIKDGTYGICTGCGKAINPERLEALPETSLCVSCAAT